jgi:hypothetical protein
MCQHVLGCCIHHLVAPAQPVLALALLLLLALRCAAQEVWQLLQEFQALISSYIMKYSPPDAQEWRSVIQEVTHFLQADVGMPVPRAPGQAVPFRLSLRCAANQAEVKLQPHKMLLHDCVLISYYPRQVKIAELPLDSFRMLQTLEWEDAFSSATPPATEHPLPLSTSKSRGSSEANGSKGGKGTDSGSDGGERRQTNQAGRRISRQLPKQQQATGVTKFTRQCYASIPLYTLDKSVLHVMFF